MTASLDAIDARRAAPRLALRFQARQARIAPAALALGLALAPALGAGPAWAEPLPAARVYAAPALNGPTARGVQISPDGALVTYLKPSSADQTVLDLWAHPVKGGEARLLLEGAKVEPSSAVLSEAEKARRDRQRIAASGVTDYSWDGASAHILIPASGDLYLADIKSGGVRKIGDTGGGATDGKISPGGGYVVYVRDQNLRLLDLKNDKDQALTTDGHDAVSFGTAEFVAQEEMDRYAGYWVSPDDRRIAFTRVDESGVDVVPRFDIGAQGATVVNQRYPRAGRPNAVVALFVRPIVGGAPVKVDLGSDPDIYLARVDWSKDGKTLYVQRESRDQTRLDLLAVDPLTGAAKVLIAEKGAPWINVNSDLTPLANGDFLWGSDRTGFHHLYLYHADGVLVRPVTQGDWVMATGGAPGLHPSSVYGVDEKRGEVYFLASMQTPLTRDLYVTSYRHPQTPRRITGGEGWWNVTMGAGGGAFVGVYTDPKTPTQTALYSVKGERLAWIEENALKPGHPYFPYLDHKTYPEFGTLKAEDGQTLYYSITKPDGFDPTKHYPAIVDVYGGPGGVPMVGKRWGTSGPDQLLTQAGFVIFRLDNRGTPNRGMRFAAPIRDSLGGPEVRDQIVGQRYLASLPFIDPKRIGVMGWSYGGYMTLRLLTEPGSGFAAGAAGGTPSDWRLYDSHYTERFMGDPAQNAAAYDAAALAPRLKVLAQPGAPRLLLLHGMADDNVVLENATRIMAQLQSEAVPFDLMLYPGQRHGVFGPGKQLQLFETYLNFFQRTLGGPQ